jgi:hypothetical protein
LSYLSNLPESEAFHFMDLILEPFEASTLPARNKQHGFLNLFMCKTMRHHVRAHLPRLLGVVLKVLEASGMNDVEGADNGAGGCHVNSAVLQPTCLMMT